MPAVGSKTLKCGPKGIRGLHPKLLNMRDFPGIIGVSLRQNRLQFKTW